MCAGNHLEKGNRNKSQTPRQKFNYANLYGSIPFSIEVVLYLLKILLFKNENYPTLIYLLKSKACAKFKNMSRDRQT